MKEFQKMQKEDRVLLTWAVVLLSIMTTQFTFQHIDSITAGVHLVSDTRFLGKKIHSATSSLRNRFNWAQRFFQTGNKLKVEEQVSAVAPSSLPFPVAPYAPPERKPASEQQINSSPEPISESPSFAESKREKIDSEAVPEVVTEVVTEERLQSNTGPEYPTQAEELEPKRELSAEVRVARQRQIAQAIKLGIQQFKAFVQEHQRQGLSDK